MTESIHKKTAGKTNVQPHPIEISNVNIWVRAAWVFAALIVVLLVSTLRSGAEEAQPNTTQLGKSGQYESNAGAQEPADTSENTKKRCRPKKPCPETEGEQP